MKKIMMVFAFLFAVLGTNAQTYKFKTYAFAYKQLASFGWTDWTDWQQSEMLVVISLDRGVINVYSRDTQEYDIVEYEGEERDREGNSMKFLCVNEDGLRCNIRLRTQNDGNRQLYVDFSDVMWVYGLTERN